MLKSVTEGQYVIRGHAYYVDIRYCMRGVALNAYITFVELSLLVFACLSNEHVIYLQINIISVQRQIKKTHIFNNADDNTLKHT